MKKLLRPVSIFLFAFFALSFFSGCGSPERVYVIDSAYGRVPFSYYNAESGGYVGLDLELLAAIAEDQGFSYTLRFDDFDDALSAVVSGEADGVISELSFRDDRRLKFDFSNSYFDDGTILVVPHSSEVASMENLRYLYVACRSESLGELWAEANKKALGFIIMSYDDSPSMYSSVLGSVCGACFEERSIVQWAIKSWELPLRTVGDVINPRAYGFAVKRGTNAPLLQMFNAGLANIKASGEYDEILARYGY